MNCKSSAEVTGLLIILEYSHEPYACRNYITSRKSSQPAIRDKIVGRNSNKVFKYYFVAQTLFGSVSIFVRTRKPLHYYTGSTAQVFYLDQSRNSKKKNVVCNWKDRVKTK